MALSFFGTSDLFFFHFRFDFTRTYCIGDLLLPIVQENHRTIGNNKARNLFYLDWQPKWDFSKTVKNTVDWYLRVKNNESYFRCCMDDINDFLN